MLMVIWLIVFFVVVCVFIPSIKALLDIWIASRIFSATRAAPSLSVSGMNTQNSSPPSLPTKSDARTFFCITLATCLKTASPIACP